MNSFFACDQKEAFPGYIKYILKACEKDKKYFHAKI